MLMSSLRIATIQLGFRDHRDQGLTLSPSADDVGI